MLAFTLSDPSTEAALLKLGTWTPLLGVLGILAVQGAVQRRDHPLLPDRGPDGFHPLKTLLAPILGFLAMAGACYLLIDNRACLSGAGDAHVHQARAVGGVGRVPDRLRDGAVDAQQRLGPLSARSGASCARTTSRPRRQAHEHTRRPPGRPSARAAERRGDRRRVGDPQGGEGARRDRALRLRHACTSRPRRPCRRGESGAARGVRRALRARRARDLRGRRLAHRRARSSRGGTSRACSRRSCARSSWPARRPCRPTPDGRRRCAGAGRGLLADDDRPVGRGLHGPSDDAAGERRILRPLTWVRSAPGENGYARPVEGLICEFDLDEMEVVKVDDHGVVPLPPQPGNYDPARMARAGQRARTSRRRATTSSRSRSPSPRARASRSTATPCAGRSGSCGSASRRARGSCCTRSATRTRHAAPDHLPRVAVGDVRPLRRPGAHAPVQERVRHGRVRRRLAGQPADAGLRLPRARSATSTASSTTRTASRW